MNTTIFDVVATLTAYINLATSISLTWLSRYLNVPTWILTCVLSGAMSKMRTMSCSTLSCAKKSMTYTLLERSNTKTTSAGLPSQTVVPTQGIHLGHYQLSCRHCWGRSCVSASFLPHSVVPTQGIHLGRYHVGSRHCWGRSCVSASFLPHSVVATQDIR